MYRCICCLRNILQKKMTNMEPEVLNKIEQWIVPRQTDVGDVICSFCHEFSSTAIESNNITQKENTENVARRIKRKVCFTCGYSLLITLKTTLISKLTPAELDSVIQEMVSSMDVPPQFDPDDRICNKCYLRHRKKSQVKDPLLSSILGVTTPNSPTTSSISLHPNKLYSEPSSTRASDAASKLISVNATQFTWNAENHKAVYFVSLKVPGKMESIFYCNKEIQDFPSIICNENLEDLLEIKQPAPAASCPPKPLKKIISPKIVQIDADEIPPSAPVSVKKKVLSDGQMINKFYYFVKRNEMCAVNYFKSNPSEGEAGNMITFYNEASPLNYHTWKMMKTFKERAHKFIDQYVKVGNSKILLNGSRGGNVEVFDISPIKTKRVSRVVQKLSPKTSPKNVRCLKKEKLLLNKPTLKPSGFGFKPGPLCKKPSLNSSSDKIGSKKVEIVKLPPVGITIYPQVSVNLEPVCHLLKHARHNNGFIDPTWANFAASVVQEENSKEKPVAHTFVLPYQNNKSKFLAKKEHNFREIFNRDHRKNQAVRPVRFNPDSHLNNLNEYECKDTVEKNVKEVILDLLKTVHINEMQDSIYKIDPDDIFEIEDMEDSSTSKSIAKSKPKKKRNHYELRKLDINIIDLDSEGQSSDNCNKDFCKLGCICSSIQKKYVINEHCGLSECMFKCDCEMDEKYFNEDINTESELPNSVVVNFQNQFNRNLTKEEKKFQRTIIRSNDQTIVLGARRRGVRLPKRYEDCSLLSGRELEDEMKRIALHSNLKVSLTKLPVLEHCEHWCMVHELYRCFCRGKILNGVSFSKFISTENEIFQTGKKDGVSFMFPKNISVKFVELNENLTNNFQQANSISNFVSVEPISVATANNTKSSKRVAKEKQIANSVSNFVSVEPISVATANNTKSPKSTVEEKQIENSNSQDNNLSDVSNSSQNISNSPNEKLVIENRLKQKSVNSTIDQGDDMFCSRTTYIKELADINLRKHILYIKRNKELKTIEDKRTSLTGPITRRSVETQKSSDIIIIDDTNDSTVKPIQTSCKKPEAVHVISDTHSKKDNVNILNAEVKNKKLNDNSKIIVKDHDEILLERAQIIMGHMKNIKKFVVANKIDPPQEGKHIIIPYRVLIASILLNKVSLWITTGVPYRQFLVFKDPIGPCVNVMDAPKELLLKYPTYVQCVHNKTSVKTYLFLSGRINMWHIESCLSMNRIFPDNGLTISPVGANIPCSITKDTANNDLQITVNNNFDNHNKETSKKSVETSQKWFIIHVGNDFEKIEIPCKYFSASYASILKVIEISHLSNKIINIPCSKPNTKFGAYVVPNSKRNMILLGPYGSDENPDINVEKKTDVIANRVKSWGVWLPSDNPLIPKLNAASAQKCSNFTICSKMVPGNISEKTNQALAKMDLDTLIDSKRNVNVTTKNLEVSITNETLSKTDDIRNDNTPPKIAKSRRKKRGRPNKSSSPTKPRQQITKIKRKLQPPPSNVNSSFSESPPAKNPKMCDSDDDDEVIIIPNENPVLEISDSD